MRCQLALLALSAVSSVMAVEKYSSTLKMNLTNVDEVQQATRVGWCRAQQNTCLTLCSKEIANNDCSFNTLEWSCTCASNNSAPGIQYYTQTIPTFICQQLYSDCINQSTDQDAHDACTKNIQDLCPTQNPPKSVKAEESTSTTSAASKPTATKASGKSSSGKASSTTSKAFAAPTMAPAGTGAAAAVAIGMLAFLA